MKDRYLVLGALGLVGSAVVKALENRGARVLAVSRRAPDWQGGAEWYSLDLTDREACQATFGRAEFSGVTHIVYCALFEQPSLISGWQDAEQIAVNTTMLSNVLDFVTPTKHLTLLQGTKAYGAHLRPMSLPGKEHQPRPSGANFYWNQEDMVREKQASSSWHFSIFRPQVVCGIARGSPMNMVAAIAVYGSLCRHTGQPFAFTGSGSFVTEVVDAGLLADAILWSGQALEARGETYNVTNGDVVHWPSLWPELADFFGVPAAEPESFLLQEAMPKQAPRWLDIARQYDLATQNMTDFVDGSWQFADAVFGYGGGVSTLLSTIKIRQHGFHACMDSAVMFENQFSEMRRLRWIP